MRPATRTSRLKVVAVLAFVFTVSLSNALSSLSIPLPDTFPSPSNTFTTASGLPVCRYALGGAARSTQPETLPSQYFDWLLNAENSSGKKQSEFPFGAPFFFYYNPHRYPDFLSGIQALCCQSREQRENLFIASGGTERSPAEMEQRLQDALQKCGGEYLDLFILEYVCSYEWKRSDLHDAMAQAQEWKRQGLVRHVGASTHSHEVGALLAAEDAIETVMLRYSMSHKDAAERLSFPACAQYDKPVLAFTTTRWNRLQDGHHEWDEDAPSTGDCLSFAIQSPLVECILHSARDEEELEEALMGFHQSMSKEKVDQWRSYGDLDWNSGDGFDEYPEEREE